MTPPVKQKRLLSSKVRNQRRLQTGHVTSEIDSDVSEDRTIPKAPVSVGQSASSTDEVYTLNPEAPLFISRSHSSGGTSVHGSAEPVQDLDSQEYVSMVEQESEGSTEGCEV